MFQPRAAVIIHAQIGRGFAAFAAEEFVQYKTVKRMMGSLRQQMVPERIGPERAEKSPILRDADLGGFAAAADATDGFTHQYVRPGHVFDDFAIGTELPFMK